MSDCLSWLPPLIFLKQFNGNWELYVEKIYEIFRADFITSWPLYQLKRVGIRKFPLEDGKEQTFFHLTTSGKDNSERLYDFRRCERIRWPKPIIEHAEELKVWATERKTKTRLSKRVCIATPSFDYLVVIEPRNGYFTLVTAFYVEHEHQRRAKMEEHKKAGGASDVPRELLLRRGR